MANEEQLEILKQGVDVWNRWRKENPNARIDLRGTDLSAKVVIDLSSIQFREVNLSKVNFNTADLRGANLSRTILESANLRRSNLGQANLVEAILRGADLSEADLLGATLRQANISRADLTGADLRGVDFRGADLSEANLRGTNLAKADLRSVNLREADLTKANINEADLSQANLWQAILVEADLSGVKLGKAKLGFADISGAKLSRTDLKEADLTGANLTKVSLRRATLVRTIIDKAIVSGSSIYGISVWDLIGEFEEQRDLIITPDEVSAITVDNIKVAQFVYLILNNEEIRDVINTLTSKSVIILGRFSITERKAILDALRNKLREFDLLPIVFDFDRPTDKDFTETIKTLAGLSYFVIADITNPKSSPLELQATVPDYQIPFVPIIQEGENPFALMVDLQKKYNWVLNTVTYDSIDTLMKVLKPLIIDPAMRKRQELRIIKAHEPEIISAKDFLAKGGL